MKPFLVIILLSVLLLSNCTKDTFTYYNVKKTNIPGTWISYKDTIKLDTLSIIYDQITDIRIKFHYEGNILPDYKQCQMINVNNELKILAFYKTRDNFNEYYKRK